MFSQSSPGSHSGVQTSFETLVLLFDTSMRFRPIILTFSEVSDSSPFDSKGFNSLNPVSIYFFWIFVLVSVGDLKNGSSEDNRMTDMCVCVGDGVTREGRSSNQDDIRCRGSTRLFPFGPRGVGSRI